jgi:hypothetical protein
MHVDSVQIGLAYLTLRQDRQAEALIVVIFDSEYLGEMSLT